MASDPVSVTAHYKEDPRSKPVSVEVTANETGLDIRDPADNIMLAQWAYADLRFVVTKHGHRLLRSVTDENARLSQPPPELEKVLKKKARQLKLGFVMPHPDMRYIIAGSVAVVLAITLYATLPLLARPLSAKFPERWQARWSEIIVANVVKTAPTCVSPEGATALEKVMARLNAAQKLPAWRLAILKSNAVEAATAPGNVVLVPNTVLAQLMSAEEFAALLAHEIGHVQARDPAVQLVQTVGTTLFLRSFVGGDLRLTLARVNYNDLKKPLDPYHEQQADLAGVALLDKAGIDTSGVNGLAERLEGGHRYGEWVKKYPTGSARARAQGSPLNTSPLLNADEWAAIKAICGTSSS